MAIEKPCRFLSIPILVKCTLPNDISNEVPDIEFFMYFIAIFVELVLYFNLKYLKVTVISQLSIIGMEIIILPFH